MATSIPIKTRYTANTLSIRPVDPSKDTAAIVALIEIGFGSELDPQGLKMLAQMKKAARLSAWSPFLPFSNLEPVGFVYVLDGVVVGNLSLRYALPSNTGGRLIGNVVVHPDHRGQGIGRALVKTAIETARGQSAHWIGLEVRADNDIAGHLYNTMGFHIVGQTQHLLRPAHIPWPACALPQRHWHASHPKHATLWMELTNAIYGHWQKRILEMRPSLYAFGGWGRRLELWLSFQREHAWLQVKSMPRLALRVKTDRRHHYHVWDMLVHPDESPLGIQEILAKALQAMRRWRPWPTVALVADHPSLTNALHNIGFETHRTLLQMVLEL